MNPKTNNTGGSEPNNGNILFGVETNRPGIKRAGDRRELPDAKYHKSEGETSSPVFSPSGYSFQFPTFQLTDDDGLLLLGREDQIQSVKDTFDDFEDADKWAPIVLTTSRGMGKTFFMKRLITPDGISFSSPIPQIADAYAVGRVFTLECSHLLNLFVRRAIDHGKFWQSVMVFNLLYLFNGKYIDGIHFSAKNFEDILHLQIQQPYQPQQQYQQYQPQQQPQPQQQQQQQSPLPLPPVPSDATLDPLSRWIRTVVELPLGLAYEKIEYITNIAFGTFSKAKPLFLVDNIHVLARLESDYSYFSTTTRTNKKHTELSSLLIHLSLIQPLCVISGTTDGNLRLSEYSTYIPEYIHLTPIPLKDAYEMGRQIVETKIASQKNTTTATAPLVFPIEFDPLLSSMCYESCYVPRLLKLAFSCWCKGKSSNMTDVQIMNMFFSKARKYYLDAISFITSISVKEVAILLMCCSTHFRLNREYLPATQVHIKRLLDVSIIFPSSSDKSYVIPAFFWVGLDEDTSSKLDNSGTIVRRWSDVLDHLKFLVPGLVFEDLYIHTRKFLGTPFSIHDVSLIWEKLIVSSLAVKYYLHSLEQQCTNEYLALTDIYYLPRKAQAYSMISKFGVNLSKGIFKPTMEISAKHINLDKALYYNINVHNNTYHHDFIIHARPFNIAGQCKSSLAATDLQDADVTSRLGGCDCLLWFYPGFEEEREEAPKAYRGSGVVKAAIQENRLGFLSGTGCAAVRTVEMVQFMKKMVSS